MHAPVNLRRTALVAAALISGFVAVVNGWAFLAPGGAADGIAGRITTPVMVLVIAVLVLAKRGQRPPS